MRERVGLTFVLLVEFDVGVLSDEAFETIENDGLGIVEQVFS